jgi:hypothetical protein
MRRLLAVLAGGLGIGALLSSRRRPRPAAPMPSADDLRAKLAESRAPEEEPLEPGVEARRTDVHERARQAIDELGA